MSNNKAHAALTIEVMQHSALPGMASMQLTVQGCRECLLTGLADAIATNESFRQLYNEAGKKAQLIINRQRSNDAAQNN